MSERIAMPDGGEMGCHLAVPESGSGPGLVVLMEIFGVGPYIRRACGRLAELGYVALAPDLFRRLAPGAEYAHTQDELPKALEAGQQLDQPGAVEDSLVALEHLRARPEVSGPVGVLGFCLGGSLAYEVALQDDPATAVCYYGSTIPDGLGRADEITCPVLFHFGAEDRFIPVEQAERVSAAAEQRPGWECHIHAGAGHAFDNHEAPMFHQPEPAAEAWEQTAAFLERTLGVPLRA